MAGVVAGEMENYWPVEALATQAIWPELMCWNLLQTKVVQYTAMLTFLRV